MKFRDSRDEDSQIFVNLHEGHRARLRQRLIKDNFASADEYQVLEYILTLVVKRKDTNELAHALINNFGKLSNVFDADEDKLLTVKGVTPTIAYFLHAIPYIFRNYKISKIKPKAEINCTQDIFDTMGESIFHLPQEEFYIMCLDSRNRLIAHKAIVSGGNTQVLINSKDIVDFATRFNTRKVVILHNHPTGDIDPSDADIETTKVLFMAFNVAGIEISDHMIVNSEEKYYSFAKEGKLKSIKEEYDSFLKKHKNEN